jgi:hypothetical protein
MKDVYVRAFYDLIKTRCSETGAELPEPIEHYCVFLLAERVEKTDIIPEPSFAERYLTLYQTPRPEDIRQFADDCLFFVSVLPEYGKRRGLNMDYYATLGISSYYAYSDLVQEDLYTVLGNKFYFLQKFLESTIKNKPLVSFIP